MKCHDCEELISGYLDNELTDAQRRQFEDHIASCAECAGVVEELSSIDTMMGDSHDPLPDEAYWSGFNARLSNRIEKIAVQSTPWWKRLFNITKPLSWAAIAFMIAVGFMTPAIRDQVFQQKSEAPAPMVVSTHAPERDLAPGEMPAWPGASASPMPSASYSDTPESTDGAVGDTDKMAYAPSPSNESQGNKKGDLNVQADAEKDASHKSKVALKKNEGFYTVATNKPVGESEAASQPTPQASVNHAAPSQPATVEGAGTYYYPKATATARVTTPTVKPIAAPATVADMRLKDELGKGRPDDMVRIGEKGKQPYKEKKTVASLDTKVSTGGTAPGSGSATAGKTTASVASRPAAVPAKPAPAPAMAAPSGPKIAEEPVPAPPPMAIVEPSGRMRGADYAPAIPFEECSTEFGAAPVRRMTPEGKKFLARSEVLLVKIVNFSDGNKELERLREEMKQSNFMKDLEKDRSKLAQDKCLEKHIDDVHNVAKQVMTADSTQMADIKKQVINSGLLERTREMKQ